MATKLSHPVQLTDAERTILAAAAGRSDASVLLPARLRGKAAQRLAQALLDKGLVREIRAKGEQPVWRKEESTGRCYSLGLTKAGLALVAEPADADQQQAPRVPPQPASTPPSSPTVPRRGSKLAEVIGLLGREQGSSVSELMAVTGWLPHTTRAALTGLRKRGYAVIREAGESGMVYRISAANAAAA